MPMHIALSHYGLVRLVVRKHDQHQPEWPDYIISHGTNLLAPDTLGNNILHYVASGSFQDTLVKSGGGYQ
jgi:hypothetical protein